MRPIYNRNEDVSEAANVEPRTRHGLKPKPLLDGRTRLGRRTAELEKLFHAKAGKPRDKFTRAEIRRAAEIAAQNERERQMGLASKISSKQRVALATMEGRLDTILLRLGIVRTPDRGRDHSADERIMAELEGRE
jgi:hypothetical protein